MTSRDRMRLAMQLKAPDRVPVMCQLSLGHYFLQAGLPPHQIWFTSDGFADALVRLQKRYRFDGILINLPGRPDNLPDQIARIEPNPNGGEIVSWKNGAATLFPPDDNPQHLGPDGSELMRADFDHLDPDRLDHADRFSGYVWNIYHLPSLADLNGPGLLLSPHPSFVNTISRVRAAVGDQVSIHGEVFSPFTHYMELFGYEAALLGLMTDSEKAQDFLFRLTETAVAWAVAQAKAGVDAVLISSAFAGGSFISQAMYRQFVVPCERRVAQAVRQLGVPVYTHTCGRIGDRLELMLETATQGVDTLDPPPLGTVELSDAKRRLDGKAFIKGNMNSVKLLQLKTREEVTAYASEVLRIGKPGGGYILSTACSVSPRVEPWKLELLAPLAEQEGRYV